MILKNYELGKINILKNNIILLYGKNEGLKKEKISEIISKKKEGKIFKYDEKEILDNPESFYEKLNNGSLFENEKIIIINRSTEKILPTLNLILEKNLKDIIIILNANILEKKSKLRSLFEKNKKLICVAFYPDTYETLSKLTQNFFHNFRVPISSQNINLIVSRCNGERENLNNELNKISLFLKNKKKIEVEDLIKLTNLSENFSINELVDSCLAKNQRKTINILNENSFSSDDYIIIIRTFLSKTKKILTLIDEYEFNNDLNATLANAKPPIFWKDKDIVKQQIKVWTSKKIKETIYKLNELEILIKKNSFNSIHLITDFILEKSSPKFNN
tara:strand:- start:410 stop:1408 length:999 start_codon:yes stop_codon:yes gene_type:complete